MASSDVGCSYIIELNRGDWDIGNPPRDLYYDIFWCPLLRFEQQPNKSQ